LYLSCSLSRPKPDLTLAVPPQGQKRWEIIWFTCVYIVHPWSSRVHRVHAPTKRRAGCSTTPSRRTHSRLDRLAIAILAMHATVTKHRWKLFGENFVEWCRDRWRKTWKCNSGTRNGEIKLDTLHVHVVTFESRGKPDLYQTTRRRELHPFSILMMRGCRQFFFA